MINKIVEYITLLVGITFVVVGIVLALIIASKSTHNTSLYYFLAGILVVFGSVMIIHNTQYAHVLPTAINILTIGAGCLLLLAGLLFLIQVFLAPNLIEQGLLGTSITFIILGGFMVIYNLKTTSKNPPEDILDQLDE